MHISQEVKGVIMRNLCGTIFYIKTNVLQDFHICMSVPLTNSPRIMACDLSPSSFKLKRDILPLLTIYVYYLENYLSYQAKIFPVN